MVMVMEGESHILKTIKGTLKRPSWVILIFIFTALMLWSFQTTKISVLLSPKLFSFSGSGDGPVSCSGFFKAVPRRKTIKSIVDFGGVGDGKTSNTAAFRAAMEFLSKFKGRGGGSQLNVPKGKWLTGCFNLTSDFTLFLEEGAVILGHQDPKEWPIIEPLPSYGRGRERLGGRHMSLIHGNHLSNVVITGQNGTIDGQGKMWWDLWWNRTLEHTRGHLVELMNSNNVMISNLTFRNSPFWTIHPVYCRDIVIRNMTILAPLNAPNTDGIDPDSSVNVCIEDCYIESGDDLVAVKSGWDQYGIKMARPSSNIIVRRISGTTPTCSGIGIGSEMSGGISNIVLEDFHIRDSAAGVRIKTDKGRGGYITNVTINNIRMERVKIPIKFSRGANDHPDEKWDPKALPKVLVMGFFLTLVTSCNTTSPRHGARFLKRYAALYNASDLYRQRMEDSQLANDRCSFEAEGFIYRGHFEPLLVVKVDRFQRLNRSVELLSVSYCYLYKKWSIQSTVYSESQVFLSIVIVLVLRNEKKKGLYM